MVPGQSASGAQGGMDTETNGMSRSMSRQRTCIPCPCRPQGMEPSLPCRPGVVNRAYARAYAVRRKQAPDGPDMPVAGRRVCPGMRGPANARRSRRSPTPSVWLCMPPHTRRNGMPKAIPSVPICRKDELTMRFDARFQTRLTMPLPDAVYGSDVGPIVVSLQMRGVRQKPEAMTATAGKAKRRES